MRRCTYCYRFHPGAPTFCSRCGRSFDVRICSRGHRNPRGVQFCSECGSADLSTPAPPASLLFHLSGTVLYLFAVLSVAAIALVFLLSIVRTVDFSTFVPSVVELLLMLGLLYWTTTLLPGPVRKVGKAAGKQVWKWIGKDRHEETSRRRRH